MDVQRTFASNLKRYRSSRGMTQSQLAEQIGMTLQTVFSYESGANWPRPDTFNAIAKILKVRPWQLLAEEGEGGSIPPQVVDQVAALARACGLKVNGRS